MHPLTASQPARIPATGVADVSGLRWLSADGDLVRESPTAASPADIRGWGAES